MSRGKTRSLNNNDYNTYASLHNHEPNASPDSDSRIDRGHANALKLQQKMLRGLLKFLERPLGKEQGKISVIVPNFNTAEYIGECIDSVLTQSYENIELIVVDDNSQDESLKLLGSIKDKRMRLLALNKNYGASKARNIGIENCSGEYITTLDSDDVFASADKLSEEIRVMKEHNDGGKSIVAFSNAMRISEAGEFLKLRGDSENIREGYIFEGLLSRSIFIPRDFLCHRSVYGEIGLYDEDIGLYEDWDIKLRISKKYEFFYSGVVGVGYRDRAGSLSKVARGEHEKWMKHVYEKNHNACGFGHEP